MKDIKSLIFRYDKQSDVLYISLGTPRPSYCEEIFPDVLLRKDIDTDDISGITIVHAKYQVQKGFLINKHFPLHITQKSIRRALR